jgi:hypothetical protein
MFYLLVLPGAPDAPVAPDAPAGPGAPDAPVAPGSPFLSPPPILQEQADTVEIDRIRIASLMKIDFFITYLLPSVFRLVSIYKLPLETGCVVFIPSSNVNHHNSKFHNNNPIPLKHVCAH